MKVWNHDREPFYFFPLFLSPDPPKDPFCEALAFSSFSACSIDETELGKNRNIFVTEKLNVVDKKRYKTHFLLILFLLDVSHVNLQNTDTIISQGHYKILK